MEMCTYMCVQPCVALKDNYKSGSKKFQKQVGGRQQNEILKLANAELAANARERKRGYWAHCRWRQKRNCDSCQACHDCLEIVENPYVVDKVVKNTRKKQGTPHCSDD